jgi:YesN/AraC family two-component response regulator
MLTARAEIQDKLKALRIGVDDYLLKPFEEEELSTRVANLLQNYKNRNNIPLLTEDQTVKPNDYQEITEAPLDYRQTPDALIWLAELEQVVAKSMTQFDFTTEGVAEKMFMGRSQFFKKVKQLTGITPNEYVQEMRLSQARTLLENRRCSTVKEVAFSVGFKDVRYFSTLFRKRFGKLPSDYLG